MGLRDQMLRALLKGDAPAFELSNRVLAGMVRGWRRDLVSVWLFFSCYAIMQGLEDDGLVFSYDVADSATLEIRAGRPRILYALTLAGHVAVRK